MKKGRIVFGNFIIYEDCQFIHRPYKENNVIFKAKKKLDNSITLYLAINEVLENFIITHRDIMEHNFPLNEQLVLKYKDKEIYYLENLQNIISSIYCNWVELKDFYLDKESTLFDLDSQDTPVSSGESIEVYMKDFDTSFLVQKRCQGLREIISNNLSENIKSLSTKNNFEVTCFVKMISNVILFKTSFHQFSINVSDTFSDLLNNMLHYHSEKKFLTKMDCINLIQSPWKISIHSNEKCSPIDRIIVNSSDSCSSIKISGKAYVLFKVMIEDNSQKEISFRKDLNQVLVKAS